MGFRGIESYLHQLTNIFYAIIGLPLLMFIIIYLQISSGELDVARFQGFYNGYIALAVWLVTGVLVVYSVSLTKRALQQLPSELQLKDKLILFRQIYIRHYLLLGLASILALLAYLLSGEVMYAGLFMIVLIMLSIIRPTTLQVIKDLSLKGEDKDFVAYRKEFDDK